MRGQKQHHFKQSVQEIRKMCNHYYAKIHRHDPCVMCFHEIFNDMSMKEIREEYKEVHIND